MPPPVVLIGHDPQKYTNGHVSYVIAHALAASRAGFSPHVFCVGADSTTQSAEFGTVHRVATPLWHFMLAPINSRPVATAIAQFLGGCDYPPPYIVHGFGTFVGIAAAATAKLARQGLPSVLVASAYTAAAPEWRGLLRGLRTDRGVRAALFHGAWYPWIRTVVAPLERRGLARSRAVLVNYESVARLLHRSYGEDLEIRRIPYAAATAFDSRADLGLPPVPDPVAELQPADAPLIVSVARHSPTKGLDVLLRALASLKADGVRFRASLVGPGRLLDVHRRLARRLGLDGQVAIPGYVDDVSAYLRHADVFVLPSLEEGSGSVALLEALQAGRAVVASSCDGIPEDIVDGEHGLLVPPGDLDAMRGALGRLLADPGLRQALGASGHRLYLERFNAERFASALGDVYAELGVSAPLQSSS